MNLAKMGVVSKKKIRRLTLKNPNNKNKEELPKGSHSEVLDSEEALKNTMKKSNNTIISSLAKITPTGSCETKETTFQKKLQVEGHHGVRVVKGPYQDDLKEVLGPREGTQGMINAPNKEVLQGGVSNDVWLFCEKGENGVLGFIEGEVSGVWDSNKRTSDRGGENGGGGGLSSNGESCDMYHSSSSSSMNSCFGDKWTSSCVGDEWIDMDWESVLEKHLPWEGEELMSWLEEFQC